MTGEAARAMGQVVHVEGRVLDAAGAPLPGAEIEIWQCDVQGIYRHPRDEESRAARDSGFQGRGRTITDAAGRYRFRTIRPVPYAGRTPHIHFKVEPAGGSELVTQMYVFGEERNAQDGVLNSIRDPRQHDSVIVRLEPPTSWSPARWPRPSTSSSDEDCRYHGSGHSDGLWAKRGALQPDASPAASASSQSRNTFILCRCSARGG